MARNPGFRPLLSKKDHDEREKNWNCKMLPDGKDEGAHYTTQSVIFLVTPAKAGVSGHKLMCLWSDTNLRKG